MLKGLKSLEYQVWQDKGCWLQYLEDLYDL